MSERINIPPYGEHEISDVTGLPVTPDGTFWRIRKSVGTFANIQLRRKGRFWSHKIAETTAYRTELTDPKRVLRECAFVLRNARDQRALADEEFKGYGDYPPNRFEGRKS